MEYKKLYRGQFISADEYNRLTQQVQRQGYIQAPLGGGTQLNNVGGTITVNHPDPNINAMINGVTSSGYTWGEVIPTGSGTWNYIGGSGGKVGTGANLAYEYNNFPCTSGTIVVLSPGYNGEYYFNHPSTTVSGLYPIQVSGSFQSGYTIGLASGAISSGGGGATNTPYAYLSLTCASGAPGPFVCSGTPASGYARMYIDSYDCSLNYDDACGCGGCLTPYRLEGVANPGISLRHKIYGYYTLDDSWPAVVSGTNNISGMMWLDSTNSSGRHLVGLDTSTLHWWFDAGLAYQGTGVENEDVVIDGTTAITNTGVKLTTSGSPTTYFNAAAVSFWVKIDRNPSGVGPVGRNNLVSWAGLTVDYIFPGDAGTGAGTFLFNGASGGTFTAGDWHFVAHSCDAFGNYLYYVDGLTSGFSSAVITGQNTLYVLGVESDTYTNCGAKIEYDEIATFGVNICECDMEALHAGSWTGGNLSYPFGNVTPIYVPSTSGAVTPGLLGSGSVLSGNISPGAVTSGTISIGAVSSGNISPGTIGIVHISASGLDFNNPHGLQIKRSTDGTVPTLASGEFFLSMASGQLWIGSSGGNMLINPSGASLSSGAVVSGYLSDYSVNRNNLNSGCVDITKLASGLQISGLVLSGGLGSGQVGAAHLASGFILPGNNVTITPSLTGYTIDANLSGATATNTTIVKPLLSGSLTLNTEELISGIRAVNISQSGNLRIAMAGVSGRMPAVGIVLDNVLSGKPATVYALGALQGSGLLNFSGYIGNQLYVGRSGTLVTSSGFLSGDNVQSVGSVLNSGGVLVEMGTAFTLGQPVVSGGLGDYSVNANNLNSGCVDITKLLSGLQISGLVLSGGLGSGQVGVVHMQSGAVIAGAGISVTRNANNFTIANLSGGALGSGAVTSGMIGDYSVNTNNLNSGCVDITKLLSGLQISGLVLSGGLGSGQVGVVHMQSGALIAGAGISVTRNANNFTIANTSGASALGSGAVTSGLLGDYSVNINNLNSGCVDITKLLSGLQISGLVLSGGLGSGQVGVVHMQSGAVIAGAGISVTRNANNFTIANLSGGALGSGAVTSGMIGDYSVNTNNLNSGCVDITKLLSGLQISGLVLSGGLGSGQVGVVHMQSGALIAGAGISVTRNANNFTITNTSGAGGGGGGSNGQELIINGNFVVNQLNQSYNSVNATDSYWCDCWMCVNNSGSLGIVTNEWRAPFAQSPYLATARSQTSGKAFKYATWQPMEYWLSEQAANAGIPLTLSCWVRFPELLSGFASGGPITANIGLVECTGVADGLTSGTMFSTWAAASGTNPTFNSTFRLNPTYTTQATTSGWQQISVTVTPQSGATNICPMLWFSDAVYNAAQSIYYSDFSCVPATALSIPDPSYLSPYRFFEMTFQSGTSDPSNNFSAPADHWGTNIGALAMRNGITSTSGTFDYDWRFRVTKRATPTVTTYCWALSGSAGNWRNTGNTISWTTSVANQSTYNAFIGATGLNNTAYLHATADSRL